MILWLLPLLNGDVIVSGQTDCPSPALVSTVLAESVTNETTEGHLHLSPASEGVAMTFTDPLGQSRTRILPAQGSCEEQAVRAGVVLAAWLASPEALALPPVDVQLQAKPLPPPPPVGAWWVGLGPGLAFDENGVAAAALGDVTRIGAGGHWGARVMLAISGTRTVAVGEGEARWMATQLAPAVLWQNMFRRFALQADVGLTASVFTAKGVGVPNAQRDWSAAWGAQAGVRGQGKGKLPFFVDLRLNAWPFAPDVVLVTSSDRMTTEIANVITTMTLGFAFAL
ncbi:MAG: hypothetical protein SF187_25335 [Deltaproteobacteria bacterium]|nr:hypothetical protein [Deltaproteobacteria bacterium]